MEYARSDFLFKGPVATYSITDLLLGFHTSITNRLNTGLISEGNIYYNSLIVPALLQQANYDLTVLTGAGQSTPAIS
jgi:hypothetical protein